ncbi:MAG: hypothetical protein R3A43_04970 [Bacteroidia bacterium]
MKVYNWALVIMGFCLFGFSQSVNPIWEKREAKLFYRLDKMVVERFPHCGFSFHAMLAGYIDSETNDTLWVAHECPKRFVGQYDSLFAQNGIYILYLKKGCSYILQPLNEKNVKLRNEIYTCMTFASKN